MSINLLLLLGSVGIFFYLTRTARSNYNRAVRALIPRGETVPDPVAALIQEHPALLPEFRARVLPLLGMEFVFSVFCSAAFWIGLNFFPPALSLQDLTLMRNMAGLVIAAAFVVDAFLFLRVLLQAFPQRPRIEG